MKKIKVVTVRASDDEIQSVDTKAEAVGLTRSAFLRKKLLGFPVRSAIVPRINWQTYRKLAEIAKELKTIGNNLNQVAKTEQQEITTQAIADEIQQLQRLIRETRLEITGSKDE